MEYIHTFFEEKNLSKEVYEVEHDGIMHFIESEFIIKLVKTAPEWEQEAIAGVLRKIDFQNGDIHHFLQFLARQYVENKY